MLEPSDSLLVFPQDIYGVVSVNMDGSTHDIGHGYLYIGEETIEIIQGDVADIMVARFDDKDVVISWMLNGEERGRMSFLGLPITENLYVRWDNMSSCPIDYTLKTATFKN